MLVHIGKCDLQQNLRSPQQLNLTRVLFCYEGYKLLLYFKGRIMNQTDQMRFRISKKS
jgi:hypothetical protein